MIILDSPIRDITPPEELEMRVKAMNSAGPPKVYPTIEAAVARFRLVPPQDNAEPYVFGHIARGSLKPVDGGYSWKFDALRIGRETRSSLASMSRSARSPTSAASTASSTTPSTHSCGNSSVPTR